MHIFIVRCAVKQASIGWICIAALHRVNYLSTYDSACRHIYFSIFIMQQETKIPLAPAAIHSRFT